MTLSNQSHFPWFFSPREMTYRNLANSGLRQAGITRPRKMTLCSWLHQTGFSDSAPPNHGRWLTGAWPIPAYDKTESARFRLVVSRYRPGPGKSSPVISPFSPPPPPLQPSLCNIRKAHRVGRVLSFFSSRRNWDSPNLQASMLPPLTLL